MKLCKDCKHYDRPFAIDWCAHPKFVREELSLVTGKTEIHREFASTMRALTCGVEGSLWEPVRLAHWAAQAEAVNWPKPGDPIPDMEFTPTDAQALFNRIASGLSPETTAGKKTRSRVGR